MFRKTSYRFDMTGSQFERMVVTMLGKNGYWAHRIAPDARGAQPFDVIAAKDGHVLVADCKVCQSGRFSFARYEENQRSAFKLFLEMNPSSRAYIGIFAWYDDKCYWLPYDMLEQKNVASIKLTEDLLCKHQLGLKSL